VVPFALNKNWNMITRVIVPFIGQPPLFVDRAAASRHDKRDFLIDAAAFRFDGSANGIGDITASLFLSPKTTGGFTWGVGPAFVLPFLAYQANKTVTLTIQSETIGDWEARHSDRWTVPINLLASKISKLGLIPASYQLGLGDFVAHPDLG